MKKSAIEQIRLEMFANGYRQAQQDAAYRFGAIAYEQANQAMMQDADRYSKRLADHKAEHGEWIPA